MPKSRLVELHAHGLGVIDDALVDFGPGFNVITGETGAGKTLLLGALDLCLGGDGAAARHAILTETRAAAVFLRRDGREAVLTRESTASGRLRSTLDGLVTSAEALRALASELIVIHGQHDSLTLRNRAEVLRILDSSGGVSTRELEAVRRLRSETRRLRESFGGDPGQRQRELEFLEYQIGELQAARIRSADELSTTLEELVRLSELRDGQASLLEILDELDADGDFAVLARMARAIERIPGGEAYDPMRDSLRGALEQARDCVHELTALADPEAFDPVALDDLDQRASDLQQIARKYGGTLEAALSALVDLRSQREEHLGDAERMVTLDEELHELDRAERELSRVARREREIAAVRLTGAVRSQLPRVALANATLRFEVGGDDGSDVQILFAPNPGLAEGPLQALASGGELSRVLLALSLETAHDDVVAVFDEIDAGVGGQVAQQIGDCLRELGDQQQVLAVTHLASVAAKADHHFVIDKILRDGVAVTTIREVAGDERVAEIARMLAGDEMTVESLALAQQLLETLR
jgi:DNA repair protein RecN (Recombination protein N)